MNKYTLIIILSVLINISGCINTKDNPITQQKENKNTSGQKINPSSIYVLDGDTVKIGENKIRLLCIDAPESNQRYGKESTEALHRFISLSKEIKIKSYGTDRYGRILSLLQSSNQGNLNELMVKRGYAISYYPNNCPIPNSIVKAEKIAKQNKRGVHSFNSCKPSDFRKNKC